MDIIKLAKGLKPQSRSDAGYGAYTSIVEIARHRTNGLVKIVLFEGRNCLGKAIGIAALSQQDALEHANSVMRDFNRSFALRSVSLEEALSRGFDQVKMAEILIGFSSVGNTVRAHIFHLRPPTAI